MSNYEFYSPIGLSAANFEDFKNLLAKQQAGTIMPHDISGFVTQHQNDALVPVVGKDGKNFILLPGGKIYTQVQLFASRSAPTDPSRMVALYIDIHPSADGKSAKYKPRQWTTGSNAQALLSYKMTCCSGVSGIASYKQGGAFTAALLENQRFVEANHRNLFKVGQQDSGFRRDDNDHVISHLYAHFAGIQHRCSGLSAPRGVAVPA